MDSYQTNRIVTSFLLLSLIIASIFLNKSLAATQRTGALAATDDNYQQVIAEFQASQFLSQATFGPTVNDAEALAARILELGHKQALEEWIDNQFASSATSHFSLMRTMMQDDGIDTTDGGDHRSDHGADEYKYHVWWHSALTANDQLRQRMAWALAQIFVINEDNFDLNDDEQDAFGEPRYFGPVHYYDMLVNNAFRDYPRLLREVSVHPVMGDFLSHVNNPKADPSRQRFPDENYAREIMQLFSIGLHEMNPDGSFKRDGSGELIDTYSNETIKEMARVFTGWHYANERFGRNDPVWSRAMVNDNSEHDTESKDLTTLSNGIVLPGGQSASQELDSVISILSTHPNTAPFISRQLIQRFVMSNPSSAYVAEIANIFTSSGGDFRAVIKAILLSDHNLNNYTFTVRQNRRTQKIIAVEIFNGGTERTRVIEPILRFSAFLRLFEASSNYTNGRLALPNLNGDFKQGPYESPTVFNFYTPDYQPPGAITEYVPEDVVNNTLYAPEFQIMDTTSVIDMADTFRRYVREADDDGVYYRLHNDQRRELNVLVDFAPWESMLLSSGVRVFFDRLNTYLCGGNVNFNFLRTLYGITRTEARNRGTVAKDITEGSILAMVESPECIVR